MKRIKNAGKGNILEKVFRKIRKLWVKKLRYTLIYKFCYFSYWYSLFHQKSGQTRDLYFAARPNPGAGIGHQITNWIAGYWFAKQFEVKFAHIPFSDKEWEAFLGFYREEEKLDDLKKSGYKVVRIQEFDEENKEEYNRIRKIISSYAGKKIIFLAEQDQFYYNQIGVMCEIQKKFYHTPARNQDKIVYNKKQFNIAIHIRRGDIMEHCKKANESFSMRYQKKQYFIEALKTAMEYITTEKIAINKENIQVYIFSQGEEKDYSEFFSVPNVHFCLDMNVMDSFLHMIYADVLIMSKSGFSYEAALLNKGIKFCPNDFWHAYPNTEDWILLSEEGSMM